MFSNPFTVSIPQSCDEEWNNMSSGEKERFCQSCQKTVTDFTQMSDKELAQWLTKQKGNGCGRFTANQLNKVLQQPTHNSNRWALRTLMLGMATWLGLKTTEAHQLPDAPSTEIQALPLTTAFDKFTANTASEADSITISGSVLHAKDKSPLPGALIFLEGTDLRTNTDSSGSFLLTLPASSDHQKLIFTLIGMKNQELAVSSLRNKRDLKVMLEDDLEGLDTVITVGGYHVKYKWYTPKGIKQRIHNLFH